MKKEPSEPSNDPFQVLTTNYLNADHRNQQQVSKLHLVSNNRPWGSLLKVYQGVFRPMWKAGVLFTTPKNYDAHSHV